MEDESYDCDEDSWIPQAFAQAFCNVRKTVSARGALPDGLLLSQVAYETRNLEGIALPDDARAVVEG